MKSKVFSLLIALMASWSVLSAQVNTAGLTSEAPQDGVTYYIVSDNGWFLTTQGTTVILTDKSPKSPEWRLIRNAEGMWYLRNGSSNYLAWDAENSALKLGTAMGWNIDADHVFREGCYDIWASCAVEFFGDYITDNDAIVVTGDGSQFSLWPISYNPLNTTEGNGTQDFLLFSTLPKQIVTDGGDNGGDDDPIINVPANDIEGDFQTNWKNGMQDAKVLTYLPMDNTKVVMQHWKPKRKGVSEFQFVIFREDIVKRFYGNRIKNLWFILPPNALSIEFFVADPMQSDMDKYLLWFDDYDFSETVAHIMSKPDGLKVHEVGGIPYGYDLNLDVKDPSYPYYKCNQVVGIPCDYLINESVPNLQVGYTITYPGDYKENYLNGKNPNGGLADGNWFSCSYLMPTNRYYYAFMMGDDDPDSMNGRYMDYTNYTSIMKKEFQWTENAGLFCFVETEGNGGFLHSDLEFEDASVVRCFTGEEKVPVNAYFVNYGVDPILSATFDVQIGEETSQLRFKNGISFLEQGRIDDNVQAPTEATRMPFKILSSKINGRPVSHSVGIDATVVAVDESDNVERMPVIEENTGTWCGWCPRGIVGMDMLRKTYGENVALIGIHSGMDSKAYGDMDEVLGQMGATVAPSCGVNRRYTCDPYYGSAGKNFGISADVENTRMLVTEASLSLDEVVLSKDGLHIGVRSNTQFNIDCKTCPYELTYVITEDGLNYASQMNYYKTQMSTEEKTQLKTQSPDLYPLTQKPNPWNPEYNDVMVYCPAGLGIEGSLTAPIAKGEKQEHKVVLDIPVNKKGTARTTDIEMCRIIALLIDKESDEIVQATQLFLSDCERDDENPIFSGVQHVQMTDTGAAAAAYDLQGRCVDASGTRGLIIQGGRKLVK